jgi:hypothetical protein
MLKFTKTADGTYYELKAKAMAAAESRKASGKTKSTKAEGLFKQVNKTLAFLDMNPKHPGLHCHEYTSIDNPVVPGGKVWEAYVQNKTPGAYRVFWCYGPGKKDLTVLAITPHP